MAFLNGFHAWIEESPPSGIIELISRKGLNMGNMADDRLCRQIVENVSDAVLFSDREGIIRFWNAGAEAMFGFPAAEALGLSLDIITPETLRARHWEGYRRVMETGASRYERELLAVPALRKDGTRISVEFSMALIRNESGEVLGVAAIIRDVTPRWQREKALRERLAALEAQGD